MPGQLLIFKGTNRHIQKSTAGKYTDGQVRVIVKLELKSAPGVSLIDSFGLDKSFNCTSPV